MDQTYAPGKFLNVKANPVSILYFTFK